MVTVRSTLCLNQTLRQVGPMLKPVFTGSSRLRPLLVASIVVPAILVLPFCGVPLCAQTSLPDAQNTQSATASSDRQSTCSLSGTILDQSGTPVAGASIKLTRGVESPTQGTLADDNGQFSFADLAPGPFQISITAVGFTPQTISGTLRTGETYAVPRITLSLATVVTQVVVRPQSVIAHEQIQQEEQQRVLGIVPNFYVTYLPHPAPLDAQQKFQLAWKSTFDPVTFFVVGAGAGLEQADGQFSGFGPGFEGYAKRYGATFANVSIGGFLGDAVFPSLLKQDPRFFYKSSGSVRSRILYALGASLMTKGDNGRWQPNYSNFLGDLASGGISNLYYPPQDRNGVALTFEDVGISMGARAADYLMQEFLVPKLTRKAPHSHF
jgi:hypothetical protein